MMSFTRKPWEMPRTRKRYLLNDVLRTELDPYLEGATTKWGTRTLNSLRRSNFSSHLSSLRFQFQLFICLVFILFPTPTHQQGDENVQHFYKDFTVVENARVGHLVGVVSGPRYGPPYSRWFKSQASNVTVNSFEVDLQTGRITTTAQLDREEQDKHSIILGTSSPSSQLVIVHIRVLDVNDETPTFQHKVWTESISESAPANVKYALGSVSDNDKDENSTQTIEIISGNEDNYFKLQVKNNSKGDKILDLVVNKSPIDHETIQVFNLIIKATDGGGRYSTMQVTINIQDQNDNEPIFNTSKYSARIAENVTVGTHVLTAEATDRDSGENGKITYSIDHQTDPEQYFYMNPETGEIKVNKPLDYEKKKRFSLSLVARDNGNPRQSGMAALDIIIENINEQPANISLVFLPTYMPGHVPEDIQVGTLIANVGVDDPDMVVDPKVDIRLYGDEGHFELMRDEESKLGLYVKLGLDREQIPVYEMTIDVTDVGTPPLRANKAFKVVVDDVNDNSPIFEQDRYEVELEETAEVGKEVIKVSATDRDAGNNRRITYRIQDNPSHSAWFAVDSNTGVVVTKATVDCELDPQPVLTIVASDGGDPPNRGTAQVAVSIRDVNDKQPEFDTSFYSIKISENRRVGDCILTVSASDPECGTSTPVTYKMARMLAPLTEFVIKPKTGEICIGSALDFEKTSSYQFQVEAVDSDGLSAQAVVQVEITDVNDNHPRFEPRAYPINLTSRTQRGPLIYVQARDLDSGPAGTVTYSIISGNEMGYFSINDATGAVSLEKDLPDREHLYTLTIRATDGGGLTSQEPGEVKISLIRGDAHPPIFNPTMFNFTTPENADIGTLVGQVQASLSVSASDDAVIQYTSVFQTQEWFQVDPFTGDIITKARLDREQHPFVVISVKAEAHFPPIYAAAQVNITILDVNDNPPYFPASTMLELEVREDEKIGTPIYLARAHDQDKGDNGTVRYRLHNVPSDIFAIDREGGEIKLMKKLDYEKQRQFEILVIAEDLGEPNSLMANMTLTVNVKDVNDNSPVFDNAVYRFHVSENVDIGYQMDKVVALDDDSDHNGRVSYSFVDNQYSSLFGISPIEGMVWTRNILDRELRDVYELKVEAVDHGSPPLSATATVRIIIDDENDNDPVFSPKEYRFTIKENMPGNSRVGTVTASDQDSDENGDIEFSFSSRQSNFGIDKNTGRIWTLIKLDYETNSQYEVVVTASDKGKTHRTAQAIVRIDVEDLNDNAPTFQRVGLNSFEVSENKPKGTEVVRIVAVDPDAGNNGLITYSFDKDTVDPEALKNFQIHSMSGLVTTTEVLDYETREKYELVVVAEDNGDQPQKRFQTIIIHVMDMNDQTPLFHAQRVDFECVENTPVGTVVGQVNATDNDSGDNGKVSYYLVGGNIFSSFTVNRSTGTIKTVRQIDYEESSSHTLSIQAVDNSAALPKSSNISVRIQVLDVNDNHPVFEMDPVIIRTVPEGAARDFLVNTFIATDKDSGMNGTVEYYIQSYSGQEKGLGPFFAINKTSGRMVVVGNIDYEQVNQITVIVKAVDLCPTPECALNTTITTVISVTDVNDNAPVFESVTSVNVFEDEAIGYPILVIFALDGDANIDQSWNNVVRYSIVSGNEKKKFHLADDTGYLTIYDTLDYREQTRYVLNISAQDSGRPPLASYQSLTINVIDVNNHPPQFMQSMYHANVSEGAVESTPIVTINATDEDIGIDVQLTYLIPEGIGDDKFSIHPTTGVVSLKSRLDRERRDSYLVTAYVKDGIYTVHYRSCSISITITDINDNRPVFKENSYSVKITENLAQTSLLSVVASDRDLGDNAKLSYSIIGGNDGKFSIDSEHGHLSTQALDRETTALYNLTIQAVDHGSSPLSATTSVIVTVLDENDNSPTFTDNVYTGSVPEDVEIGTTVMTVTAKDTDLGENSKISYSLGNDTLGFFEIDSLSGEITTSGAFDREKIPSFSFLIVASDHGVSGPRNSTARVDVEITDINDNAPTFRMVPYTSSIPHSTQQNSLILIVHASDPDAGPNSLVEYSLMANTDSSIPDSLEYFRIDRTSGSVYSRKRLLTAPPGLHSMLVVATDSATPASARMSSTGVVEIRVGSEKNQDFKFSEREYYKQIPENSPKDTSVITVQALYTNLSISSSQPVVYSFASGNENNAFSIHPTSGKVIVAESTTLDFETLPKRRLIISASNNRDHAYTTLWVDLIDVNDNRPKFSQPKYVSAIWENNQPETFVTQVIARDLDSGKNGAIEYNIIGGNEEEVFEVARAHTGIIQTSIDAAPLDRDSRPQGYRLIIEARDGGRPAMSSTCILVISIVDENDTPPLFPNIGSRNVSENREAGYTVVMATANDVDLNSVLVYDFTTDGNPQNTFSLDRSSGRLTLAKPLDHEDISHYSVGIEVSDGKPDHTRTMWMNIYVEDENDNAPVFSQPSYEVTLPEETEPKKPVVTVRATDLDSGPNAEIVYSMAISPVDSSFYIDSFTGTIFTNRTISFISDQSIIQLVVVAKDKGLPVQSSMVAVHIQITDINKFTPRFLKPEGYSAEMSELAPKGHLVLTVSAIDDDAKSNRGGESMNYTLQGVGKETFYIEQRTGHIIYNGGADYDEGQREFNLVVVATDRGIPPKSASVPVAISIMDENDNPPVFVQKHYNITLNEDFPALKEFPTKISVTDKDSGANAEVKFTIISGNTEGIFFNPNNSGGLMIMKGMELDYESSTSHHLILRAIDCDGCPPSSPRLSAFVTVDILVNDVNDHHPVFLVKHYLEYIEENSTVGTTVFQAHANDDDAGEAGRLRYSLMEVLDYMKFSIDPWTGYVRTKVVFDYESPLAHKFYNLTIVAEELDGHHDFAEVTIQLLDKDEFKPRLSKSVFSFDVSGSAKTGDFIGRVEATDEDGGEAGMLVYSFVNKDNKYFHIDMLSGNITVAYPLHKNIPEDQESSSAVANHRQKRAADIDQHELIIQVWSGQPGSKFDRAVCEINVDRSCDGCAAPANMRANDSMDGGILAAIIIACILIVVLTVCGILFFLYRRRNPRKSVPNYSSNSTLDLEPPPHLPSDYMVDSMRNNARHIPQNVHPSDVSDQSHNSASSGRGSAEVEEEEEDEEISRINSHSYIHSSQAFRQKAMPDSGIQHDDDTLSEPTAQTHQEYLANLGIDSSKIGKPKANQSQSKESIHQFSDEGGGEGGVDTDFEKITDLETEDEAATLNIRGQGISFHEPDTKNIGSLSNVVNSEEVNSGSYNWDYLIDWGPQYQPLAHVFSEIAKLKDESVTPKKQPIKTVPQQKNFNSSLKQPKVRTVPPPIITNAPPMSLPSAGSDKQLQQINGGVVLHGQKAGPSVPNTHRQQQQQTMAQSHHVHNQHPHHSHPHHHQPHPHHHHHHHQQQQQPPPYNKQPPPSSYHHHYQAPGNPSHVPSIPPNPPPALPPNHPLGYNFSNGSNSSNSPRLQQHPQQRQQQQQLKNHIHPHHHHPQQHHHHHNHSPHQHPTTHHHHHRLPPPTHPPPDPPEEEMASPHQSSSGSRSHQASTTNISLPSLPRSPISYESSLTSAAMTPSLTPSLSPLATRSPSISPVVSSGHNTPGQNLNNIRASKTHSLSSSSEREFTI